MPIALSCPCGRSLNVKGDLAGRKIRCPECQDVLKVPGGEEEEYVDVQPVEDEEERRPKRRKAPELDDEDKPRKKSKVRASRSEGGGFGSIHAGSLGGIAMMVVAVVWFVLGLKGGYIFYYPPVLFVLGLIAFFKGLAG